MHLVYNFFYHSYYSFPIINRFRGKQIKLHPVYYLGNTIFFRAALLGCNKYNIASHPVMGIILSPSPLPLPSRPRKKYYIFWCRWITRCDEMQLQALHILFNFKWFIYLFIYLFIFTGRYKKLSSYGKKKRPLKIFSGQMPIFTTFRG